MKVTWEEWAGRGREGAGPGKALGETGPAGGREPAGPGTGRARHGPDRREPSQAWLGRGRGAEAD